MAESHDDDLFQDSTMTFGEHLEELRGSLIKSFLALALGFVLGLAVGKYVVEVIEAPLREALDKYYSEVAVTEYQVRLQERREAGENIPAELSNPKEIDELVYKGRLLFEEVYILPQEALSGLKQKYPGQFDQFKLPQVDTDKPVAKEDLLRIFLWHTQKDDLRTRILAMGAQEGFMAYMKASFVSAVVISSPLVFWFLWSFVAAGLYPHERRYVNVFLPFSLGLFLLGVAVAYFIAFPLMLRFFFQFNRWLGIDQNMQLTEWLSFVLLMPLAFGVSFQLPLIMLFLERIGVVTVETFKKQWRIAILVIAVASMILAPSGDPQSMLLLLVPLTLLYFGGIFLCLKMPRPAERPPSD